MKSWKSIFIFVLMASLSSTTWAWARECPSVSEIISKISGCGPEGQFVEDGKYGLRWTVTGGTGFFNAWTFVIRDITAGDAYDAYMKAKEAVSTLSGNPEPEPGRASMRCTYNIGFGYKALATQLNM